MNNIEQNGFLFKDAYNVFKPILWTLSYSLNILIYFNLYH